MTIAMSVQMIGDERFRRLAQDTAFVSGPLRTFLARSGFTVEAEAKRRSPVDTGRLRASIATDVQPFMVSIGSNVKYAPFVEFGTRPHFPPLQAMQPWARRHGFPSGNAGAFLVAKAIARRGTKPKPFLVPALVNSLRQINIWLEDLGKEIEARWKNA